MEKEKAREIIRQAVAGMTEAERVTGSREISGRLMALPEVQRAQCVMAYLPMPDELDIRPFLAHLIAAGKRVYAPHTVHQGRRMIPVRLCNLEDLTLGAFDIAEPVGGETCASSELDFILVPGRGFDRAGNRLGRGAGYYDRFMAAEGFSAVRCGAAFSCQVLPQIPCDDHDFPVEILVTEKETLRIARSSQG